MSMRSHGTSSREVRSRDPAAVGEIPHLDRAPPPGPKYPASIIPNTLIIPHTSAHGKKSCFPAGRAPRRKLDRSARPGVQPPAPARRIMGAGEAQRSDTEGGVTLWLAERAFETRSLWVSTPPPWVSTPDFRGTIN